MADDIVTRLREVQTRGNGMCCGSNSTVPNPYYNRCQEAADEIERLRTDRDQWRTLAESFSVCPDGCEDCKNEYEEMVNGKV